MTDQYDSMTIEQLDDENQQLMQQKEDIRTVQRSIALAVERRLALDEVAQMSPARRAALVEAVQLLEAEGVATEETFGEPGAAPA